MSTYRSKLQKVLQKLWKKKLLTEEIAGRLGSDAVCEASALLFEPPAKDVDSTIRKRRSDPSLQLTTGDQPFRVTKQVN